MGLVRPAIIPPVATTAAAKVLKKKFLKCLWVNKVVEIGIFRPATVPQVIVEVVKVMDMGLKRLATLPHLIAEVVDVVQV